MVQTNTESIHLWSCTAQWPFFQSDVGDYIAPANSEDYLANSRQVEGIVTLAIWQACELLLCRTDKIPMRLAFACCKGHLVSADISENIEIEVGRKSDEDFATIDLFHQRSQIHSAQLEVLKKSDRPALVVAWAFAPRRIKEYAVNVAGIDFSVLLDVISAIRKSILSATPYS